MGAFSIVLTLPLSLSANAATFPQVSHRSPVAETPDASVPQRWRNYALASITPGFSWATAAERSPPQDTDAGDALQGFALTLKSISAQPIGTLNLSVAHATVDGRVTALAGTQLDVAAEFPAAGLTRTIIAPSFTGQWGQTGAFGVTAVLAYQRFASLGLGESTLQDGTSIWPVVPGETSSGVGVRLDVGNTLFDRLSWSAAVQSRVDMDAFDSVRGVFTEPGQFDIPASASVGLSYALTPTLSFDVGAQRVMYSDITPFTSPALPRRFLALLGSGASPVFAWQDLTVYSAGWTVHNRTLGDIELRYTTRLQPSPTSALLQSALAVKEADHALALGYSRATGRHSSLNLQAIYTSAPYFLGVPNYRANERIVGSQLEYEAAWALRF